MDGQRSQRVGKFCPEKLRKIKSYASASCIFAAVLRSNRAIIKIINFMSWRFAFSQFAKSFPGRVCLCVEDIFHCYQLHRVEYNIRLFAFCVWFLLVFLLLRKREFFHYLLIAIRGRGY